MGKKMKKLLLVGFLISVGLYASEDIKAPVEVKTVEKVDVVASVEDGQRIYAVKCAGCHGQNGDRAALGKSAIITGQDAGLTIEQLTQYKEGKLDKKGMGGLMKGQVASLDEDDIKSISEYISEMK